MPWLAPEVGHKLVGLKTTPTRGWRRVVGRVEWRVGVGLVRIRSVLVRVQVGLVRVWVRLVRVWRVLGVAGS